MGKLGLPWFGTILNFSPSKAFICNMMMKYNAHCASKQGEAKYCVFHCREYLGREWSTFSRIMRFAQFLYVEIQPQGCDNNPETSQFLIPFLIENIHFVYLWTFVCYFCTTMNLGFFLLFHNMALTYDK